VSLELELTIAIVGVLFGALLGNYLGDALLDARARREGAAPGPRWWQS